MKKLFLITGLMFALVDLAQAELAAPTLLKPDNAANLSLKKAANFTWQKATGASKYRIIFSNNESFANYDANKFKCLDKMCFTYTVTSTSYKLAASNAMLKTNGNYFWQVQALNKQEISEIVTATTEGGEVRAFKITNYSKIANDGSSLPDSAVLGEEPTDWACTKDNKTGLIWEVKTDDSGLRNKYYNYAWFNPDNKTNGGGKGYTNVNPDWQYPQKNCSEDNCNTYAFTNAVNKQGLCGKKDWRMPTKEELRALVYCPDGNYKALGKNEYGYICASHGKLANSPEPITPLWESPTIDTTYFPNTERGVYWTPLWESPTIDTTYFPNTERGVYWSSSIYTKNGGAWGVDFLLGDSFDDSKDYGYGIRLVRNAK